MLKSHGEEQCQYNDRGRGEGIKFHFRFIWLHSPADQFILSIEIQNTKYKYKIHTNKYIKKTLIVLLDSTPAPALKPGSTAQAKRGSLTFHQALSHIRFLQTKKETTNIFICKQIFWNICIICITHQIKIVELERWFQIGVKNRGTAF